MNVIINYPNEDDIATKFELDKSIAKFNAILIKEKIDKLNIDNSSKKQVFEDVINYFKSD